jgi:mRNA interferase RelE/StbE
MMYNIIWSSKAKKQLGKLEKNIQSRIFASVDRIRIRPEAYVTKLVGDDSYRLRVGDYRVIMDLDQGKLLILVIRIGHRKEIYK